MSEHQCIQSERLVEMENRIGKALESAAWKVAFWVMTSFMTGGLLFIGNGVIANDRMRATEDTRIESIQRQQSDLINDKLNSLIGDMREVKATLGIKLK